MHPIQQKILSFADKINLKRDGFRQIGRLVGEPHPFKVSYHLKKLEEKGFIKTIPLFSSSGNTRMIELV